MRTIDIDVADDAAFARWFGPVHATEREMFPDDPGWTSHELRAFGTVPIDAAFRYVGVEDDTGDLVGSALARVPTMENLDVLDVFLLNVRPAHRRRGAGRALLSHLERAARDEGRTTFVIGAETPVGGDDLPLVSFAAAVGLEVGLRSAKRELTLPADPDLLDRLELDALPHATDYELRTWLGGCPDDLLEGRLELAGGMSTDTPHDDLDPDPEVWDEARLRAVESLAAAQQRTRFAAGAVHRATGRLVGFSDIAVSTVAPELGYQYDTIVAGPHRGHRLGFLVKIANLRAVMAATPRTKRLHTWNADANTPMISVNEALGFVRVAQGRIWKKILD